MPAEQHKQQIADNHRRKYQRQIDDPLQHALARQTGIDQQPGHPDTCRRGQYRGGAGYLEGKDDGVKIRRL